MKGILLATVLIGFGLACPAGEGLPRNPFWPLGYEGMRYPITTEPRIKPLSREVPSPTAKPKTKDESAAEAARKAAEEARQKEEQLWSEAIRKLDFGTSVHFASTRATGSSVTIDGKCYGVGDLISKNVDNKRFTWSVEEISSDGKLKLKRLQYRSLRKNEQK